MKIKFTKKSIKIPVVSIDKVEMPKELKSKVQKSKEQAINAIKKLRQTSKEVRAEWKKARAEYKKQLEIERLKRQEEAIKAQLKRKMEEYKLKTETKNK